MYPSPEEPSIKHIYQPHALDFLGQISNAYTNLVNSSWWYPTCIILAVLSFLVARSM